MVAVSKIAPSETSLLYSYRKAMLIAWKMLIVWKKQINTSTVDTNSVALDK